MKAQAEWTALTEGPVASYSASKRDKVIGIGLSAKHQGQRSYQTALTGRRHDCTRPAKLKYHLNHLAKRAPSRHDATAIMHVADTLSFHRAENAAQKSYASFDID